MSDEKKTEEKKQTVRAVEQPISSDGWSPQPLKIRMLSKKEIVSKKNRS